MIMKNNSEENINSLLAKLGCKSTASQFPNNELEAIAAFLSSEYQIRQSLRIQRLFKLSGISTHQTRTFEQFDFSFNPKIPMQEILAFRNSNWIQEASNLVLMGDTGIGKTHIAKALCFDALQYGIETRFITAQDLVAKIKKAPSIDTKLKYFATRYKVLCIDELGYISYQKEDTDILFQVISKRSEVASTIMTSNQTPKDWGSMFSGAAATAILDRLSFNGLFLSWEGDSYRATKRIK